MLTIDVKVNGELIAQAQLVNVSELADISDYRMVWTEHAEPTLGIGGHGSSATITGHRRHQSVWALVAKASVEIIGQLIRGETREIGDQIRTLDVCGRE